MREKIVKIFNGRYGITRSGRVYSYYFKNGVSNKLREKPLEMKQSFDKDGYISMTLNGRPRVRIHRLVLETFVGPCPEGRVAGHKNGIRTDNRVANLYWATHTENQHDRFRHGTHDCGERNRRAKLNIDQVKEILSLKGIESSTKTAARYGITDAAVRSIRRGINWAKALELERLTGEK